MITLINHILVFIEANLTARLLSKGWECVPLKISDQLYFPPLYKVWNMLHQGSVGRKVRVKNFGILHLFGIFFDVFFIKYQIPAAKY